MLASEVSTLSLLLQAQPFPKRLGKQSFQNVNLIMLLNCFLKSTYLFIWLHWTLFAACGIFFVACELLVASCGVWFPDQGLKLDPLHWECGVLVIGSPERSLPQCFKAFSDRSLFLGQIELKAHHWSLYTFFLPLNFLFSSLSALCPRTFEHVFPSVLNALLSPHWLANACSSFRP